MTPTVMRSSARRTPIGPGARCFNGGIALNRCVAYRAPASMARAVVAASASVWPMAAIVAVRAMRSIASIPPGSSGASVIICTPAAVQRSISSRSGGRRQPGSWTPARDGAR